MPQMLACDSLYSGYLDRTRVPACVFRVTAFRAPRSDWKILPSTTAVSTCPMHILGLAEITRYLMLATYPVYLPI